MDSLSALPMAERERIFARSDTDPHLINTPNEVKAKFIALRVACLRKLTGNNPDKLVFHTRQTKFAVGVFNKIKKSLVLSEIFGWAEWTRTTDPHLIRVVL